MQSLAKHNNLCDFFLSRITYFDNKDEEILEFTNLSKLPDHLLTSKHYDHDFPPEYQSIENMKNLNPAIKKNEILWKRLDEILGSSYLVFKKSQASEYSKILPGIATKNTYFLSALGLLEFYNKNLIERLFLTDTINNFSCYAVVLNYNGEWCIIDVDDYFPFSKTKNQVLFSRSEKNEVWLMILEKAYAKLYGSYENIQNGNIVDAIFDLTGIPYEYFNGNILGSNEELIKKIRVSHEMSELFISFFNFY